MFLWLPCMIVKGA